LEAELTQRQKVVLGALAARPGSKFAPVQAQKLFFLIDENIANQIGGRQFSFEAYDYGPFDKEVYHELEALKQAELVEIQNPHLRGERRYTLTPEGQAVGQAFAETLAPNMRDYIGRISEWVRSLTFAELVGSIYKAYPEMKANSIFKG